MVARAIFILLAMACLTPWVQPWMALLAGCALALALGNPFPKQSKIVSKILLQVAVVLLGFAVDFNTVIRAGQKGILFALVSITCVFLLGWALQRLLNLRPVTSLLVSTGTAICGGSAIAAMSSVLDAPQEDVSVSVATVFLLNAVGLLVFPPLGHMLALSPEQFGTWAGIAIHDVSSVVGAGKAFGGGALEVATAVKLSRVLYLVPIVIVASYFLRRVPSRAEMDDAHIEGGAGEGAKLATPKSAPVPWFIGLFLLAALARTYIEPIQPFAPTIKQIAGAGFALSLFLIGAGLTRQTLKQVGIRPMLQGVVLWLFISLAALAVVKFF